MKAPASFLKAFRLFAFLSLLGLSSCEKQPIAQADLDKIRFGMSIREVEKILGNRSPTTTTTTVAKGNKETMATYQDGTTSVIARYNGKDEVISWNAEVAP